MKTIVYAAALALGFAGCSKQENPYVDEKKAIDITCVNNLKQIAIAFQIWAGDHGDKYPFEVSTNAGGVMELVTPKDGLRQNGYLIFKVMSNEITAPLVFICPQDKSKHAATNSGALTEANVSYVTPADTNILVMCPIDGNILYADDSIFEKRTGKRSH